jgi:hypothetical protein
LLDDLQAAAASLAQAGDETVPAPEEKPVEIDSATAPAPEEITMSPIEMGKDAFSQNDLNTNYGQMIDDALANSPTPALGSTTPIMSEPDNPAAANAPAVPANPEINGVPEINYMPMPGEAVLPPPPAPPIGMDTMMPEPAPTIDSTPSISTMPVTSIAPDLNAQPLGPQPAMQDQIYNPQASDPNAFRIPGM